MVSSRSASNTCRSWARVLRLNESCCIANDSVFSSSACSQNPVLERGFAQPHESAHHVERQFHCARAGQHHRGHGGAVFGEGIGQVLAAAAGLGRGRSLRSQIATLKGRTHLP
jgi:hypothetical protein